MSPKIICNKLVLGMIGAIGQIAIIEGYKVVKKNMVQTQTKKEKLNRNFVMYDLRMEAM